MNIKNYKNIYINKEIKSKWQNLVNILVRITGCTDALITRVKPPYIYVFKSSNNDENQFKDEMKFKLHGHFCEKVIEKNGKIEISNALKDEEFENNPEVKEGLIAYLGYPIHWSDGNIFGTLCLHDKKEHFFSDETRYVLEKFRELIESHLNVIESNREINRQIRTNKKTIKRLHKVNRKFSSIFNNINQGICLHEIVYKEEKAVDYMILDANPAYEKILNISLEDVIGSLASEIYKEEKPPYLKIYSKVAETGKIIQFEDYYKPMNKYFEIIVTSPEKGKFITLFRDITKSKKKNKKLKDSKEKYEDLFNKAPIGIFRTNSKGEILKINPTMAEIAGFSNVKNALENYKCLQRDLYKNSKRREEFIKEIKDKGELKNFEYEAVKKDGENIWINMNARISKMMDSKDFEIEGYAFDITEKKKTLQELTEKTEELNAANEQLTAYNEELMAMNEELDQSFDELNEMNNRFVSMINIVSSLDDNKLVNEETFFSNLLSDAVNIIPEADYGKICIIEGEECKFLDAIGHDIKILKNLNIGKDSIFYYDEKGVFKSEDYSIDFKSISKEQKNDFKKALRPIKESIFINITVDENIVGRISLDIAKGSNKNFSDTTKKILESFAILSSSFFAFKKYNTLQSEFTRELISSIINILEIYDFYTKGHSENVANLSAKIAEEMNLANKIVMDCYWAGMVHDIGKLLIPTNILNKDDKLSNEEYELIKKHPVWGSEALSDSKFLRHISNYILYHHERWDGKGYPAGLRGDDIPLVSQILSVADSWDAMRSKRAYREPLSRENALEELERNKGSQFSPSIVDLFLKIEKDGRINEKEKIEIINNENIKYEKDYFKYLFDKTNEGIVILDEDFNIIKVNEFFTEMFGYNKENIIGRNIADLIIPCEKENEREFFVDRIKDGEVIKAKTYRINKEGKNVDVNIHAFPISLRKGKSGYYVIYKDISEMKIIEKKFINYKNRYRSLFENDDIVMLIINPENGKIIDANPAAENFYGWSKKELINMRITEINILSDKEIHKEMQKARNKNKRRFRFKHKNAKNEVKSVEVYSQPIKFGEEEYLYSIIHDISYVKEKNIS